MQLAVRSYLAAGSAVLSTAALAIAATPTIDIPTAPVVSSQAVQLSAMTDAEAVNLAFQQAGGATLYLGSGAILLFRGLVVDPFTAPDYVFTDLISAFESLDAWTVGQGPVSGQLSAGVQYPGDNHTIRDGAGNPSSSSGYHGVFDSFADAGNTIAQNHLAELNAPPVIGVTLTQVRAITVATQQANALVRNGVLQAAEQVSHAVGTLDPGAISTALANGGETIDKAINGKPAAYGAPVGSIQNLGAVKTVTTTLDSAREAISASLSPTSSNLNASQSSRSNAAKSERSAPRQARKDLVKSLKAKIAHRSQGAAD